MHKKSMANNLLLCMLSTVAFTMQAGKVEELIKENRKRFAIEQASGSTFNGDILKNPWSGHSDLKCRNAATTFREYILGNEGIFTEKHLSELFQCINYYQTIYADIDTKKLDFLQNKLFEHAKKTLSNFNEEVDAYKAAVGADKQANK